MRKFAKAPLQSSGNGTQSSSSSVYECLWFLMTPSRSSAMLAEMQQSAAGGSAAFSMVVQLAESLRNLFESSRLVAPHPPATSASNIAPSTHI